MCYTSQDIYRILRKLTGYKRKRNVKFTNKIVEKTIYPFTIEKRSLSGTLRFAKFDINVISVVFMSLTANIEKDDV